MAFLNQKNSHFFFFDFILFTHVSFFFFLNGTLSLSSNRNAVVEKGGAGACGGLPASNEATDSNGL